MPGQSAQVFTSSNDYYQIIGGDKWGHRVGNTMMGSRREGICFALTTVWCKNVLDGHRPLLTKAPAHRGEALQAKYRISISAGSSYDDAKQEVFALAGVKGEQILTDRTALFSLLRMAAQAGVYLVSNGAHILGFRSGAGNSWFYDCDENGAGGLWIYDSVDDWMSKVQEDYEMDEEWSVWKMTL